MKATQHLLDLQALIALQGRDSVERTLNVHRTTVTRWLDGEVRMPAHAQFVVSALLGNLPGTDGKWPGFRFFRGELIAPDGTVFRVHEVTAIPLKDGLIKALQAELKSLHAQLAAVQKDLERVGPAANGPVLQSLRANARR